MYVIIIILVIMFAAAFYIAYQLAFLKQRNKKGIMAVESAYKRLIQRYKLTISEVNRLLNRLIAIDRTTGKVILIVYKNGITWEKCIGLEEIRTCEITTISDHEKGYTSEVNMELTLRNNYESISFPFFKEGIDDIRDLRRRTKQSRYWKKKIEYYLDIPETHRKLIV